MNWIKVEDELPKIDESDRWNKETKQSKDVLCYHPDYGLRFGRYYYSAGFWTINGVTSSSGVKVTHWMPLSEPPSN